MLCATEHGAVSRISDQLTRKYDLALFIHSPDRLYLPAFASTKRQRGIDKSSHARDVFSYNPDCKVCCDDLAIPLLDAWRAFTPHTEWEYSIRIYDIRLMLLVLEQESDWDAASTIICANTIFDTGFRASLINTIRTELPFRFYRDEAAGVLTNSIIESSLSSLHSVKTDDALAVRKSKRGRRKELRIELIQAALYAVGDAVALLSLFESSRIFLGRDEVHFFLDGALANYKKPVRFLFDLAATVEGRGVLASASKDDVVKRKIAGAIADAESLVKIIKVRLANKIARGETPIPANLVRWRDRNRRIYNKLYASYIH